MSNQQVKIPWPFDKDEKAQLIWLGDPFRHLNKMMCYAYFRSNGGTKKIMLDWGTLPALAIQHFYVNGDIRKSISPSGIGEIDMTIYPNVVNRYEKAWHIYGSKDKATSRSFIFPFDGKTVILPVIEVIRSILAPNRFLLYRLYESNSFPQYLIESYEPNKIHLSFSSQYELKYTKPEFLFHLVWLLTNSDVRQIFENLAYSWFQDGFFNFEWDFRQPISFTARVKESEKSMTILQIVSVKNKHIPFDEISISHPGIFEQEKSSEPKKYTFRNIKEKGEDKGFTLDEKMNGSTEDFDLIEMNKQKHEYNTVPKVTKIKTKLIRQRTKEDKNTKKYYGNDSGIRSTADVGGQQLARGLEHKMLHEIQTQGELQDFINVLKELEHYPQIKAIRIILDVLPKGLGERKFTMLSDGVTRRKYVIAEVYMVNGFKYKIVELEREQHSLSILILSERTMVNWQSIYDRILLNVVNDSGTWTSNSLKAIEKQGVIIMKLKHSSKGIQHRAQLLLKKLI